MRLLLPGDLELETALQGRTGWQYPYTFARIAKNCDPLCYSRAENGQTLCIREKGLQIFVPELGGNLLDGLDGTPSKLIAKLEAFLKTRKKKRVARCGFGSNVIHSVRSGPLFDRYGRRLLDDALRRGWWRRPQTQATQTSC